MTHRILIPFELPDARPVSRLLIDSLAPMDIVLLGHYGLPEQTPPEAAREEFEDEAQQELDGLAADFTEADVEVRTRLVFGKDRGKAIETVADEERCDAELRPAPTDGIDRVLVPLLDTANLDRLADFVRVLIGETGTEVTLFHVVDEAEETAASEEMLAAARDEMVAKGFGAEAVDVAVLEADNRSEAILAQAEEYDAVVIDESHPTVVERIVGELPEMIAQRAVAPVIVVRQRD
jgi:nucleotide-binding universal stress UspA family protein